MAPAVPPNHDQALSHSPANPPPQHPSQLPPGAAFSHEMGVQLAGLDSAQIINLLRSLPGFNKSNEPGNLKEDAAQTLSNLSQSPYQASGQHPYPGPLPGINDPGPSSHPRGPPNLGQLSALAMSATPAAAAAAAAQRADQPQEMEEVSEDDHRGQPGGSPSLKDSPLSASPATTRRGGRSATMGSDEWSRQRKDNHKEVERRRRGNINEGINELGRIVPNGSGEKSKGAILARAVQYIHHLKENEARNIEKWTLEKLLMDQAMGDLQTQLEELKKAWESESLQRMRVQQELETFQAQHAAAMAANANTGGPVHAHTQAQTQHKQPQPPGNASAQAKGESLKRNGEAVADAESGEKDGKRPRTG